jgi:putative glutamine amidotransferase
MAAIGVTASESRGPGGAVHPDLAPYLESVRRAGGEPLVLSSEGNATDAIESLDGILFTGGVDVDPTRYGGRHEHANSQRARYRADRDAFEIALVREARERKIPVLCICRGVQLANVAFGGTLIEDIGEEYAERYTIDHRQTRENGLDRVDYAPGHDVILDPASVVARVCGASTFATNSMHHQALRALGDGLVAAGRTSDGTIEAVDASFEHPFFIGVQWHPEELDDEPSRRLFSEFVRAARVRGASGPLTLG